jgi:hypothetical protein
VEGKITMGGCDAITVRKKQKLKELKQNPTSLLLTHLLGSLFVEFMA